MKRTKLVLIGAGSAMFAQGLVGEMIQSGRSWKLGLVDIDAQALRVAEGLSRRMVQGGDADIEIEASTERRDLLRGADVVVATVGVGGRRGWESDVFIPRKYGIYQPVGDSVMAGGISRAMRMIPAMVAIAEDVHRLCPKAIFLNYSNPMSVIVWAVSKATQAQMTGLCIGVHEVKNHLADMIGKPREEVSCLAAGLNHFTWIYDLRWKGEDAWNLVREAAVKDGGGAADNPFSWSLFETYGAFPSAMDRHVTEFFPERFPQGKYYGKQLGVDAFSFEGTIAHGDAIYAEMSAIAGGEKPLAPDEGSVGEHSQLVEIITSIQLDQRKTFSANLPNQGTVPGLPDEAVLEVTAAATGRGIMPLQVKGLPEILTTILQPKITAQALTVEAALSGSRSLFVEALLADGCVHDPATAGRLADELLKAHAAYLPQFE